MSGKTRKLTTAVLVLGTMLSIALGAMALVAVKGFHAETATLRALDFADRLSLRLRSIERQVVGFAAHMSTMDRLDPLAFARFYEASLLGPSDELPSEFAFMPELESSELALLDHFVATTGGRYRAAGYPDWRPGAPADGIIHLPVVMAEPPAARTRLLGFDLAHALTQFDAAQRAIATGSLALSDPIPLGDPVNDGAYRLLLVAPVRLASGAAAELGGTVWRGAVAASIDPEPILQSVLATLEEQPDLVSLSVVGNGRTLGVPGLNDHDRHARPHSIHQRTIENIRLGDRMLTLEVGTRIVYGRIEIAAIFALTALGFLCTLIIAAFTNRADHERALVAEELGRKKEALERAAAASQHAQRLESLGRLVGGVAHDFNNLLTVILGNLEFLREDPHSAERDAFVDEAMRATERGRALTRQLLAFGRRAPLEPERVDIAGVLGETQRVLARVLPTAVTLDLSPPHALMAVRIDRNQLENALLNLVLNARDAMPEGGRISLSAANTVIGPEEAQIPGAHAGEGPDERLMPGSYVVVEVSDTGHGMDEETLARAFEPFFTTKEVGEGSGLGLSMVFGFARQSGGSARIASRPGAGTTVWLYFPAIEAASVPSPGGDRHAGPADAARAAGGGMAPLRVLLAEDDEAVRRVVAAHLRAAGHAVTVAENGDRAMAILARTPAFDLLVSDVVMPGRAQGPDLASMALKALPSLRIVFLSGYPQGQRSGAHEMLHRHPVLQKPVAAAELAATIDTVMATRRAA